MSFILKTKKNTINMNKLEFFLSKNITRLIISIIGLLFVFFATRFPFFYYFKVPQIGPDTFEYYEIVRMLSGKGIKEIGFPGVGFPFFLKLLSSISNTLLSVVFIQTVLQFISISLFLFVYNRYYHKYFYWVFFILLGYLSASFNQYYDTCLYPDSLLSTLFIFFTSFYLIIFNSNSKYLNVIFCILSFLAVYAISVRANGILLLPLFAIYFVWLYLKEKSIKVILIKIGLFLIPLIMLCLFNLFSPVYNTFSPIGIRKIMYEDTTNFKFENEKDSTWQYLKAIVPEDYFYKEYQKGLFNDSSSFIYINSYGRGYRIHCDNDSVIVRSASDENWGYPAFNINLFVDTFSVNKSEEFEKFQHYLKQQKKKVISVDFEDNIYVKSLLFVSFFKYYYAGHYSSNFTKENNFFYEDNLKNNYWRLYEMHEGMKGFRFIYKDVFKEFYGTKFLNDKDYIDDYKTTKYWQFKSSIYFRYIVKPFYDITDLLFRNLLFPIMFLFIYIFTAFKVFSKSRSGIHVFLFGIGSLLLLTNILHSIVLGFLLSRYTYQVSSIYYIFVAFVPLLIFQHKMQRNVK